MVTQKIDYSNLNELNRFNCKEYKEYLMYLRFSLGKVQKKAEVNEMRRTIFKIEEHLQRLNEKA